MPSARELVALVEAQLGWEARWDLRNVVTALSLDLGLTSAMRQYLVALLNRDELDGALRGAPAPDSEVASAIDALIRQSALYRESSAFEEMVKFMAQFRDYAPYNNMLVRIQNPHCGFYATPADWLERFGRVPQEDARPMVILAPMHPVMFVYGLDQTKGDPVPEELLKFATLEGDYESEWMVRMVENARRRRIKVDFKVLSSTSAGYATVARETGDWKMRIVVDSRRDEPSRFGILCHELAHVLLGHLGTDHDLWWPSRLNLTRQTVEIEAEAATYIATSRLGLKGTSAEYLSGYLPHQPLPPAISIDFVARVAGLLERMARESVTPPRPRARPRKARRRKTA